MEYPTISTAEIVSPRETTQVQLVVKTRTPEELLNAWKNAQGIKTVTGAQGCDPLFTPPDCIVASAEGLFADGQLDHLNDTLFYRVQQSGGKIWAVDDITGYPDITSCQEALGDEYDACYTGSYLKNLVQFSIINDPVITVNPLMFGEITTYNPL
jgi:hypothetical protein